MHSFTRITTGTNANFDSLNPSINSDGSRIAFESAEDFLNPGGGTVGLSNIWIYDTSTMTYTRVTSGTDADRDSTVPSISGDGTRVAFISDADLLNEGEIGDNQYEVWLFDTDTMTLTRISTTTAGRGPSGGVVISGDGSTIAFHSDLEMEGESIASNEDEIWIYHVGGKSLERLTYSTPDDGTRTSTNPALSWDGSRVTFQNHSDFLNQGIPVNAEEIWMYDYATDSFNRVTDSSEPDLPQLQATRHQRQWQPGGFRKRFRFQYSGHSGRSARVGGPTRTGLYRD